MRYAAFVTLLFNPEVLILIILEVLYESDKLSFKFNEKMVLILIILEVLYEILMKNADEK